MADIEVVVNANVQVSSAAGIATASFGTPMIAVSSCPFVDRTREYRSPSAMLSDGWAVTDPGFAAASAVFAQNPRPEKVVIGRRANQHTQAVELTYVPQGAGFVHTLTITQPGAADTAFTYTELGGDTADDIHDDFETQVTASSLPITAASPPAGALELDADNAGDVFGYLHGKSAKIEDVTPDAGLAADLAAILTDNKNWYAFTTDSNSPAEIAVAGTFAESNKKPYFADSFDDRCWDPGDATDPMSVAQAASLAYSTIIFAPDKSDHAGAAWMGSQLPATPGTNTWAHKTLAGVAADPNLVEGDYTAIKDKNGNCYRVIAGKSITLFGTVASGEFIDIVVLGDWFEARTEEEVFALLISAPKIPYTQNGAQMVRGAMERVAQLAVTNGAITPDYTITVPVVADLPTADKAARNISGMEMVVTATGAIHTVKNISITLNTTV